MLDHYAVDFLVGYFLNYAIKNPDRHFPFKTFFG